MKITELAKEFIIKEGGNIYIKDQDIANCCIEANFAPELSIGIPKNKQDYYLLEIDSINVYVDKNIFKTENLTIDLKKFLGIKYLVIDGWKTF